MDTRASIVYSKINIKRNIDNYNFVNMLTNEKKKKLENEVVECITRINKDNLIYDLSNLDQSDKEIFFEEELISSDFFDKNEGKFIYFLNKNLSISVNDRDHLNIYIVRPDFKLEDAYGSVEEIEKKLSKNFNFSASNKYGYLTSNIKNSGIAMGLNVVVHLHGLMVSEKINDTIKLYAERGYIITPVYFQKKEEHFGYYNISTKLTYGVSEHNLIERFVSGIESLIGLNYESLFEYYNNNKENLVDSIFRSFGLLRFAISMDFSEAMLHLTNLRTGLELELKLETDIESLNKTFIEIKEGFVSKFSAENNINDLNKARAAIIKKNLSGEKDV